MKNVLNGINGRLSTTEGSDSKSLQQKLFKMKQGKKMRDRMKTLGECRQGK